MPLKFIINMGQSLQAGVVRHLCLFAFLCLAALPASALIFNVSNTNDTYSFTSLRGAIMVANQFGGKNTIILGGSKPEPHRRHQPTPRVYHLTISGADEDAARTGDLDVTRGELTIIGATTNVVIDATGLGDRVFQVFPKAKLTLQNVTITGGKASDAQFGSFYSATPYAEAGGAIYNAGLLILDNCVITNNSSGGGAGSSGNAGGREGADGGGIYNKGTATMSHCVLIGNTTGDGFDGTSGGYGGGIKNDGTCVLTDCVISKNQSGAGGGPAGNAFGYGGSGGDGGGIYNSGKMVFVNCIIGENICGLGASGGSPGFQTYNTPGGWGGNGGSGAGIYNLGELQLAFSSVYGNATGNGGNGGQAGAGGNAGQGGNGAGIYNGGKLSLNTSTVSGNTCGYGGTGGDAFANAAGGGAGGSGGGIYNVGSLNSTSCTISFNQTGAGGNGGNCIYGSSASNGGLGGDGGGILNGVSNTNVILRNTLVAQNLVNIGGAGGTNADLAIMPGQQTTEQIGSAGANGIGFDLDGDFTSQGFNLISIGDGSTGFTNAVKADQVGSIVRPIDPRLGPLQMNGGPTPTHALLPGSPAIDQGNSFGLRTDQRGDRRPYNNPFLGNAPGGDGSDIGAFEVEAR